METTGVIATVIFVGLLLAVGIVVLANFQDVIPAETSTGTQSALYLAPVTLEAQSGITSLTAQVYNQTWIECDGLNDFALLNFTESKTTISYWFKNATTEWTSVIRAGENDYVNNVLDNTYTFFPYYRNEDLIYLCKTDSTTFLNVSIDKFEVYERILNTTEIGDLYNEKH